MAIKSTNWTDTAINSTDWDDTSINSTDWSDTSTTTGNYFDASDDFLLLETGSFLLQEQGLSQRIALESN